MLKSLNKNYIKNASLGILAILLYFVLSSLESVPFALFGVNMDTLPTLVKVLYSILFETVLMLLIVIVLKDKLRKDFQDLKKNHQKYFSACIKYWLISVGVMMISNLFIQTIAGGGVAGNEEAIRSIFKVSPFYMFFSAVIFAPVVEELIFRQSIRNIFKTDWLFILVSGLLFGSLHVASNFTGPMDLLYIIPYSAPGFAFAYMLKKYDNIFVSMGFHFMHNGILIALQFLLLLFG
ncbi:MAG: CPBP family intramembrane metalloprotease [Bacilli bacterium]|nr:CPBP family intramembrane metalloprotease [Bacilli bacterium]